MPGKFTSSSFQEQLSRQFIWCWMGSSQPETGCRDCLPSLPLAEPQGSHWPCPTVLLVPGKRALSSHGKEVRDRTQSARSHQTLQHSERNERSKGSQQPAIRMATARKPGLDLSGCLRLGTWEAGGGALPEGTGCGLSRWRWWLHTQMRVHTHTLKLIRCILSCVY